MDGSALLPILVKYGLITHGKAENVLREVTRSRGRIMDLLMESGIPGERGLYRFIRDTLGMNPNTLSGDNRFSLAGVTRPRYQVSGDFYGFFPLDESRVAVALSDVSGKGLQAGILAILLADMLKTSIHMKSVIPASIMRQINQISMEFFHEEQFATFVILILDMYTGTLEYSCAGSPPLLLYRSKTKEIEMLDMRTLPVGIDPDFPFTGASTTLERGDTLLLYTDGGYEAQNLRGTFFGVDRIKELLYKNASSEPGKLVKTMLKRVSRFSFLRGLNDDTTFVAIQKK